MSEHELWNELGNLYFMSGVYNQAANAYQRSIQSQTEFGRPYSNLALTYVQQGKYEEAIELYRRSIELLTDNKEKAISWNRLGSVYRHLKDYSKAVIAFQEADELDPRSADDFPPAVPPRGQAPQAPSSVLDEPIATVDATPASQATVAPAGEAKDEAVADTGADLSAEAVEDSVAEAKPELLLEAADQPATEPMAEPVAHAAEELVAEVTTESGAEAADEPAIEVAAGPVTEAIDERLGDAVLGPVCEAFNELVSYPADQPMLEALDQSVIEAAEEPAMDIIYEPATDQASLASADPQPELEWWDVDDERIASATGSESVIEAVEDDPTTSWTPADLSQFQQDVSRIPETGSLTTWGDPNFDDDFELWPRLDPAPDPEAPDPEEDDFSTWLPIPDEEPINMDDLSVPPFVDELELEAEPPSDWNGLPDYHIVNDKDFEPLSPVRDSAPANVDTFGRNNVASQAQKAWEPQGVDIDVQERPGGPDFAFVPHQHFGRAEAQPLLQAVQPAPLPEPAVHPVSAPLAYGADRDEKEMREIELGIEKFRRVVQLNPRNANAWDALGTLYKSAGLYKDAILAYQQAISNDPSKSLYYHHLGLVYACEGRDEDAISAFQHVIEIDPEYSLAHATLGGYYRKMGLEELAQKHIGTAMKNIFDSENEYNRACLEAICGHAEQAIKLLDVALKNKQTYVDWILRDPDLDFIRQDPRFKQLISRYTR